MPLRPKNGGRARYAHLYVADGDLGVAIIMLDKDGKPCGVRATLNHECVEVDIERLADFNASLSTS